MFKIVKEIHTYQNYIIKFRIYEKFLWFWIPSECFSEFETYELAEESIIERLNNKQVGIIEVHNNIYKYYPYSLPIP